jgi:mRNA interferase RelE/StbE
MMMPEKESGVGIESDTMVMRFEGPRAMADQASQPDGRGRTDSSPRYRLVISEEAREQLRSLPKPLRRNIGLRLDALQGGLTGDVKKLTAHEHKYRLRVGSYRILFRLEGPVIFVYAVKHRREAYE